MSAGGSTGRMPASAVATRTSTCSRGSRDAAAVRGPTSRANSSSATAARSRSWVASAGARLELERLHLLSRQPQGNNRRRRAQRGGDDKPEKHPRIDDHGPAVVNGPHVLVDRLP